ncbi:MAG: acsL [Bacteroidota bacterium]|nr:acsL [Bacteroidota bacterium]
MFQYRIFDFLDAKAYQEPNSIALVHRESGNWISTSFREYKARANQVSMGLISLGIKKGDLIGSISVNRPEWNFLDLGVLQIGAVHVSLLPASGVRDVLYILKQTELAYFFCGNRILYRLLLPHLKELHFLKGVYCFDEAEGIRSWNVILPDTVTEADERKIEERKDKIKPEDVAMIIYTSGTGGNPKGAVHTHASFGAFAEHLYDNYEVRNGDRAMSALSVSHSFERLHYYFYLKQGMAVYYADSSSSLIQQIKEVKPHTIVCVPLLIEGFYKALTEKYREPDSIEARAIAYTLRFEYDRKDQFYNSEEYKVYESYYQMWKEELGGSLKQVITGAAMIPEYLVKFFWSIKVPLFECYGSTEALLHSINHERFKYKPGTVGLPPAYAEMRIGPENEIWMKSKSTMKGYYKLGKLTRSVLDDKGWYHSGDTGFIDEDGFLHINGRANTIFKLMNGKYLNPELLEQQLSVSHYIRHIFITQDANLSLVAVIRPNTLNSVTASDRENIILFIRKNYNASVLESERIEKILFIQDNWSIETEDFTPTMKLKRKMLLNKYLPILHQSISII